MPAEPTTTPLTRSQAQAHTDAIRADLTAAVNGMRTAIAAGVPTALDYPTAWAWAEAELGELLRQLRLPRDVRLHLVDAMDGLPVRAIADRLGVSVGTIQNDRIKLGKVIPIRPTPETLPTPTGKVYEQTAEWLRRHPDGLTLDELGEKAGWREGKVSGALSYLKDRGLAVATEQRRGNQRVHLLADTATT